MVFCGLYPIDGDDFSNLREALEKLRLNDASVTYEPETSGALGFGFRCGFLGLLHMEIVRERLEREFDLSLIATAPSVEYRAHLTDGTVVEVHNPSEMPEPQQLECDRGALPAGHHPHPDRVHRHADGPVPDPAGRDGRAWSTSRPERLELVYRIPLAEVVMDFFDALKSRTKGYASLDYEPAGWERADLVKIDVLLNGVPVDAFSAIVHRSDAQEYGRKMTEQLRELIPRQMFDVPIQAAIGGRIIARETVKAKRKDVLVQVLRR